MPLRDHPAGHSAQPLARLNARDRAAWDAFARLVKPLAGRGTDSSEPLVEPVTSVASVAPMAAGPLPVRLHTVASSPMLVTLAIDMKPAGMDAGSWKRFTEGKIRPQARLDLHGCTVNLACDRLVDFVQQAHATGLRCVEVITGLGQGAGGIIRQELPFWLSRPDCAPLLLAASHSSKHNRGSVRLLLRRSRS